MRYTMERRGAMVLGMHGAPIENTRGRDRVPTFAMTGKAERWFEHHLKKHKRRETAFKF